MTVATLEPYLDKRKLAEHYSVGTRWIEDRMAEGMPHYHIARKAKFRVSEIEPWLIEHGFIESREAVAA